MLPLRGRIFFRQYIPGKQNKYSLKLFKLCIPEAFMLCIEMYGGKNNYSQEMGFTESVVLRLMINYLDEGATLFTDNCYTSVPLAHEMLPHKTYLCETVWGNQKGLWKEVISANLKREMSALENAYSIKAFH